MMFDWIAIEREFGPSMARIVASYAPRGAEREDLAQEVAVQVHRALGRFRGEASLRTYVLRITQNVCLRHALRRRQTRGEELPELPDPGARPEDDVVRRRRRERLRVAVRQLPVAQRQVVVLALEDLSHREIAETLGISENAVATRFHRAKAALRTLMEAP